MDRNKGEKGRTWVLDNNKLRKSVFFFQSGFSFANHKLRLRFLCLKNNSVLHNRFIPGPPSQRPNRSRPTWKLKIVCVMWAMAEAQGFTLKQRCRQSCVEYWKLIGTCSIKLIIFFPLRHFPNRFNIQHNHVRYLLCSDSITLSQVKPDRLTVWPLKWTFMVDLMGPRGTNTNFTQTWFEWKKNALGHYGDLLQTGKHQLHTFWGSCDARSYCWYQNKTFDAHDASPRTSGLYQALVLRLHDSRQYALISGRQKRAWSLISRPTHKP